MSDTGFEDLQHAGCSDSESEPSLKSFADYTQKLGVNVWATSADPTQELTAGRCLNLLSPQSAPYKGNPPGHVPTEEAESCKGGKFLETQTHTNPLRNTPPTLSCHRGWATGDRGRGVRAEGAKISTQLKNRSNSRPT